MLRLFSDKNSLIKETSKLLAILVSFFVFFFVFLPSSFAATYHWNQSDWSGGVDTSSAATHESNQSAWTKYYSKDDSLSVNSDSVSLSLVSESLTHNSSVGFTSGTLTNTEFSGNNLQLKTSDGNKQVAVSNFHSCALKSDNTVWCWGNNDYGQLGSNTTTNISPPVQVLSIGGSGVLTDVAQITVGDFHSCAIKSDNTVWCWGRNNSGQLGNNTTTNSSYPVQVLGVGASGVLNNVSQISVGESHSCALKSDNTVWCWGDNTDGKLGINSTINKYSPVQVLGVGASGLLTNVTEIEAGNKHTCAIKSDNTLWCWGYNFYSELGIGNYSSGGIKTPVQPVNVGGSGVFDGVARVSAGLHTCATKTDGTVFCWGRNDSGQLGNNSGSSEISSPVQVLGVGASGVLSDVNKITVGNSHSCALKSDNTVWCWGGNGFGQLGINNTSNKSSPVQVLGIGASGVLTNVSQINTNGSHTCVIKNDNSLLCWGDGTYAQLGYLNSLYSTVPTNIISYNSIDTLNDINQITAGNSHTCARKTDGTVWCWGNNDYGRLGDNTTTKKITSVQTVGFSGVGVLEDINQITAGSSYSCGTKTNGAVWCWGYNMYSELGIGFWSSQPQTSPVQVLGAGSTGYLGNVIQVDAGNRHTCVTKTDGTAWCWGDGAGGKLGNNNSSEFSYPVQVVGVGASSVLTNVNEISAGNTHTCATKTDSTAWCWGSNSHGQLGTNNLTNISTPVQVLGVGASGFLTNVNQISAGNLHTCAVKNDGTVWCWGSNSYGKIGNNSNIGSSTPVQVLGVGASGFLTNVNQISAGNSHTCAAKNDGTAWCWGYNNYGQLGNNSNIGSSTPVQVLGAGASGVLTNVSQVTVGDSHTCAAKTDGTSWCWGYNSSGQLGNNRFTNSSTPSIVFKSPNDFWTLYLSGYYSSGSLISPVINLGKKVNFNSLSLAKSLPISGTSVKIQIKSSDTESGLVSTPWSGPTGVDSYYTADSTSPESINLKQYVQYQAILETNDQSQTPQLSSLGINYQSYSDSGFLISSPYDTQTEENLISGISWIKSTPDNTFIKYQLRSSSTQNGLTSANWLGPDGTSSTFFTSNLGQTTPSSLRDGLSDRWLQYKTILETTDGSVTPTLYDNTLTYVVNAPPTFDTTYQTNGFGITRSTTPGVFNFLYKIGDTDTSDASAGNQYQLWPTFQYTLDNGGTWTTITPDQLTGYTTDNPIPLSDGSTYVETATIWDATDTLDDTYETMKIRIIVDDHEAANNTAIVTSDSFVFDTKKPLVSTVDGGGLGININHNQTTSLGIDKTNNPNVVLYFNASDDSDLKLKYSLNSSFVGADYQDYTSSIGFTLPSSSDGSKRVYVQFKDIYNNESEVYSDVIQLDTSAPGDSPLFLQDISNPNNNEARLFLNWSKNTASDWKGYKIYRSIGTSESSHLASIDNINSNYIIEDSLVNTNTYAYKITNIDDLGNESIGSTISQLVWGNPTDLISPIISDIQVTNKTTSSATISWTTNEVTNSSILYSIDETYSESKVNTGYSRQHSLVLSGLTSGTQYYFKIRATDPSGNSTDSAANTFTTNTPDTTGPVITNISTSNLSLSRIDIGFTTDEVSSSFVEYSTTSGFTNGTIFGQNDLSINHTVSLRSLLPSTDYYYKVRSVDAFGNQSVSNEQSFTTLTSTSDKTNPVISNTTVSDIRYNTATISFTTDENSSSFVEFGKDTNYGRIFGQNNSVTGHSITLPYDLSPETIYYYRVRTKDISGNESIGIGSSFTTSADPQDSTLPIISNVTINEPQQNSVTITWSTNEPATSYVGFSQDGTYSQEQGNSTMTQNHSVTLVGLNPKTLYYFRVKSVDPSGNLSYDNNSSQGYQFSTANGSNPPTIYANQIRNVTTNSADVYWETNTQTNSYVEYGLDTSYGNLVGLNQLTDSHTISLSDLISGATYHFRVKSATLDGAQSVSQNFTLTTQGIATTTPPETVSNDPSEETVLDKIKNGTSDLIKKVLDLIPGSALSEEDFVDKMNTLSPKIVSSPSISSSNITVDPGVDKIVISWTTDKKSNSVVLYTPDSDFDSANPVYSSEVGKYDESVTSHSIELTNLNPNTTYHYKVRSKSEYGNWTDSTDFTFTTLSVNSEIRDFRFTKVTQKSVSANWSTTFDSRAMIEITDVLSGKSIVKSEEKGFSRDHSFTTDQLQTSSNYQLQIITVAKDGTVSEASLFPFSTSTSSEPPLISNIRISNALISGAVEQVQTIISWKTDKPSTSRILYNEGTSNDLSQSTSLDKSLVTDHIVVTTNLKPGKVYKFKVESADSGSNISLSKDYLIMTPKTQESVINLIIDNFMESFSFVTKGKK